MKRSFVIPFMQSKDVLRLQNLLDCLKNLRTDFSDAEIIIAEQYRSTPCLELFLADFDVQYVPFKCDAPFSRSTTLNLGAANASQEFLVLLDADIRFKKEDLACLPDYKEMLIPYSHIRYASRENSDLLRRGLKSYDEALAETHNHFFQNVAGITVMRREFYLEIGGYPYGFYGWGSEDDAFLSVFKRAGGCVTRKADQYMLHVFHEEDVRRHQYRAANADLAKRISQLSDEQFALYTLFRSRLLKMPNLKGYLEECVFGLDHPYYWQRVAEKHAIPDVGLSQAYQMRDNVIELVKQYNLEPEMSDILQVDGEIKLFCEVWSEEDT